MAFLIEGPRTAPCFEWWLGRVLAQHRKASSSRSVASVREVSLGGEQLEGVQVLAAGYEQAGSSREEYTLSLQLSP